MSENIWHMSVCVWFISLEVITSILIHIAINNDTLFFFYDWIVSHYVNIPVFFVFCLFHWKSTWVNHILSVINNSAINAGNFFISFGYITSSVLLGDMESLLKHFE